MWFGGVAVTVGDVTEDSASPLSEGRRIEEASRASLTATPRYIGSQSLDCRSCFQQTPCRAVPDGVLGRSPLSRLHHGPFHEAGITLAP